MNFKPHDPATARTLDLIERHAGEQAAGGWISREDAMRLVDLIELLAAPRRDHFAVSVFDVERPTPKTRWPDVWDRVDLQAVMTTPPPMEDLGDGRWADVEPSRYRKELRPAMQSDMDNVARPDPAYCPVDLPLAQGDTPAPHISPDGFYQLSDKALARSGGCWAEFIACGWDPVEMVRDGWAVAVPALPASTVDHASHRHYAPDERRPPATGGLYGEPRGDDFVHLNEAIKRGDVS